MSEVNHGPLPNGGFWAGFCSNPECDVLGCPGDCRMADPDGVTEPFTPRVWIHEDTVIVAHRFGGCYEQIRVGNTGLDDPEEISVLPPDAVPLIPCPTGPWPDDSCSTCGAEPNEPCRDGCAYAARTRRGL